MSTYPTFNKCIRTKSPTFLSFDVRWQPHLVSEWLHTVPAVQKSPSEDTYANQQTV